MEGNTPGYLQALADDRLSPGLGIAMNSTWSIH